MMGDSIQVYRLFLKFSTYLRKLRTHRVLEVFGFRLGHLARAEVEDLFAEQLEDDHVVLAEALVGLAGADDIGDERLPVFGPFTFQDLRGKRPLLPPAKINKVKVF